MRRVSLLSRICLWLGTITAIMTASAFVLSLQRSLSWDSSDSRHECLLIHGAVSYGWRPVGWSLANERYPPQPGWGVAHLASKTPYMWRIRRSRNANWEWVTVPLWIPFLVATLPTAGLWYRNRRAVVACARRCADRLKPAHPLTVTHRLTVGFGFVHFCVILLSAELTHALQALISSLPLKSSTTDVAGWVLMALLVTTPIWAVLWAHGYVRFRNYLFMRQPGHHCKCCGYNLNALTELRCPECGTKFAPTTEN